MKTCRGCRWFTPFDYTNAKDGDKGHGACHAIPPQKSSERGGSYRPRVHRDDPSCGYYLRPLPPAVPLPKAEVIRLEVTVDRAFQQTLRELSESILGGAEKPAAAPARMQSRQGRWHCWHTQSATVRAIMSECGLHPLLPGMRVLGMAEHVMGISGGIFVDISNHPDQVPDQILALAERAGMMRIRLSDEWLRSKAERLAGR